MGTIFYLWTLTMNQMPGLPLFLPDFYPHPKILSKLATVHLNGLAIPESPTQFPPSQPKKSIQNNNPQITSLASFS